MLTSLKEKFNNIPKHTIEDGLRVALQSSTAVAIVYLVMHFFDLPESFVAVLSAALVIQVSVGNTYEAAKGRVVATLIGCGVGAISLLVIPEMLGTWRIAFALVIAVSLSNFTGALKEEWSYGVVGAVAVTLATNEGFLNNSLERCLAISFGVLVGCLCSTYLWAEKSTTRATRAIDQSLEQLENYIQYTIQQTISAENDDSSVEKYRREVRKRLDMAEEALQGIKYADASEIKEEIDVVDRLYNSVLILKRVSEKLAKSSIEEPRLNERLSDCRNLAREVIKAILEEDKNCVFLLDELCDLTEDFTKLITNSDFSITAEDRSQLVTLSFGLAELTPSLGELVDTRGLN